MFKIFKKKSNDNVVEMKDFDKEQKRRDRKKAIKLKWNKFKKFVAENKEVIVTIVVAGAPVVTTVVKKVSKHLQLRHERIHRDLYHYDPSTKTYWHLKKKPSSNQWLEFERRKANGEKTGKILSSMNLLK